MKHVIGMSGGVDSQATALWALQRYPKEDVILVNIDPGGNGHPITSEFLATYAATIHPIHFVWRAT